MMQTTEPRSPAFSFETRQAAIDKLPSETWDLLIIGGGVTGAACARDAALRGIRTLLVEADDFASGTSSGSSKLIHGGVRYLQNFEFKLVYTAIQERERLEKLYAPLVRKLDFVFPTYKSKPPSKFLLGLGLSLYDSFSFFRENHKSLSRRNCEKAFPFLKFDQLTGAQVYSDSFAEDYRLVVELVKASKRSGAECINKLSVKSIENEKNSGFKISFQDHWSSKTLSTRAKYVINCSGPFSDQVRKLLSLKPKLHLTQGVHFIVPKTKLPIEKAFVLSDPENDRILFAVPWNSVTYFGTTDTDIKEVGNARATSSDLAYVLQIMNTHFSLELKPSDIIQSWAGVRPLLQPENDDASNSKISREHVIEENPKNLFHILGGKLTSHREMAEEAIDQLTQSMKIHAPTQTKDVPLQGEYWNGSSSPLSHLGKTYGCFEHEISSRPDSKKRIEPSLPHSFAEIDYAIEHELALSPIDFLKRRSSLYYECPSLEVAKLVAERFRSKLQFSDEIFEREWQRTLRQYEWDQKGYQT